jgi:hypothetical protein
VIQIGCAWANRLRNSPRPGPRVTTTTAIATSPPLPQGILPPTGNRMDAPCCDVFRLEQGRIQLFDCYPLGMVILGQLGVLGNLDSVLQQHATV